MLQRGRGLDRVKPDNHRGAQRSTESHRGRGRLSLQRRRDVASYVSTSHLSDVLAPVLEGLLDQGHELVGDGTVDEAMVVAQG
jgi:hypothetical protein